MGKTDRLMRRFLLRVCTPVAPLWCLPLLASGRVINFQDEGGTPGDSAPTATAVQNSAVLNKTLAALVPGDTLLIPNETFSIMGGVFCSGLDSVTIQIDGTLSFSDDIKAWPKIEPGSKMPVTALTFENTRGLTLTSSGIGTLDGNGAKWWGIPGIGYLLRGKDRPVLMSVKNMSDFLMERLLFLNSPRFNFGSKALNNATIRHCQVSARRTKEDGHGSVDLTAFNTDGFDLSGRNIHVHDCAVWNQDDTICIKADGEDTENVLVERVNASGVGLSIGSIGANHVRNITFRDAVMHHTYKGIYIKFRDQKRGGGSITDILYENIFIDEPESWPIWIGPAQQDIKPEKGPFNPCHGDPCSLCWPKVPGANCDSPPGLFANITLRNITVNAPKTSPGVIFGNGTVPIRNLTFDGVRIIDPPQHGAWGTDYYYCKGVASGHAIGGTWPVPPCFQSSAAAEDHFVVESGLLAYI